MLTAIPTILGGGNHTKAFADAASKPEAHALTLKVLQGLANVGLKFFKDDDFAIAVKKSFIKFKKGVEV